MTEPDSSTTPAPSPAPPSGGPAPDACAVVVAAGRSTRMGAGPRKVWIELAGRPVLLHSLEAFRRAHGVRCAVVVAHVDDVEVVREACAALGDFVVDVVPGGDTRTDSVRRGVAAVPADCTRVLVHDAARPLVRPARIDELCEALREHEAALLATPVRDTLHRAADPGDEDDGDGDRTPATSEAPDASDAPGDGPEGPAPDAAGAPLPTAVECVERAHLWAAQTPQGFHTEVLRAHLERAAAEGLSPTDEAALHERYAGPVTLVAGDPDNLKLTTVADVPLMEALLAARAPDGGPA